MAIKNIIIRRMFYIWYSKRNDTIKFFFIIVFIAEIVLTVNVISLILKCDKKVCDLNSVVSAIHPEVQKSFCSLRIAINTLNLSLNKVQLKIEQKKNEYKTIIFKYFITAVLFLILNTNGKRIMSSVETVFTLLDLLKRLTKNYV